MNIQQDTQFLIMNFTYRTPKELKPQSKTNNQGRSGDLDENEKKDVYESSERKF